jgi:hypothetical protein
LQTFFMAPKRTMHYFRVQAPRRAAKAAGERAAGQVVEPAAAAVDVSPRDRLVQQLIEEIKERWADERAQQEKLQQVLAAGADRHETSSWLKRAGWTAHFREKDLSAIYACSRLPEKGEHELRRLCAALDRLFFERCIGGLQRMPLMTRLLLASPHPQDAHSRPFGPLQEKTSIDRYLGYWKRFLCYCLNVLPLGEATLLATHGVRFSRGQRGHLEQLAVQLADAEGPEEALDGIRSIVAEMISDAEGLLWDSLMFKEGEDARFTLPLARIEDDLTQTQRGRSFLHSNRLAGKEVEMLEDLVRGPQKAAFLDQDGQWK